MARGGVATYPVAVYGLVLIAAGTAYFILVRALVVLHGTGSPLAEAVGADVKGKISIVVYAAALALAPFIPMASLLLYIVVAGIWLIPDRRFEPRR